MNAAELPRVLIVDDSRMVRATIIKGIRGRYQAREEVDGEAGWETLLVDPTIRLVISDLSMPRLDGYGLIARMRAARIARIREMPVIMISGDEDEASRQRAKDLGATDFITKGAGTTELLARLDTLLALVQTHESLDAARAQAATDAASGLLTRAMLLRQATQALSYAHRHGGLVSALVVGFDWAAPLAADEAETLESLMIQFARLLAGTVRKEDSLARWSETRLAVVTHGIDWEQTRAFAERLRAAIGHALIQRHGRTVTATVGVAHSGGDGVLDAEAILAVAEQRMAAGQAEGGNRVVVGESPALGREIAIDEVLALVAAGHVEGLRPHLPEIGLRLLPLIQLLDKEFALELPLVALERRLSVSDGEINITRVRSGTQ